MPDPHRWSRGACTTAPSSSDLKARPPRCWHHSSHYGKPRINSELHPKFRWLGIIIFLWPHKWIRMVFRGLIRHLFFPLEKY